jgi:hypothetical protein
MSTNAQLLSEILTFCQSTGMSETTFGVEAVRDGHLVRRLREGKSITTRRLDQCRDFMRCYVKVEQSGQLMKAS